MQNPKLVEEPPCIKQEDYYPLKERRFDCFNPPTKEEQEDIQVKRLQFFCPCPPKKE